MSALTMYRAIQAAALTAPSEADAQWTRERLAQLAAVARTKLEPQALGYWFSTESRASAEYLRSQAEAEAVGELAEAVSRDSLRLTFKHAAGRIAILNAKERLQRFAADMLKAWALWGGGEKPAETVKPRKTATATWKPGLIKVAGEALQEGQPADFLAIAMDQLGGTAYRHGAESAYILYAPDYASGLPDGFAVARRCDGKWITTHMESGLWTGRAETVKGRALQSGLEAIASAGPEKLAQALARIDKKQDHSEALASWRQANGIGTDADMETRKAAMEAAYTPATAEAPAAAAVAASLAIGSAQASSAAAPATEAPAPAPAPAPAAYTLPANTYTEWDGCEREDYKPSDRQKIMAAAVARAIASGLFYTRDVLDFVCADLQPSEETKAAGINRVEGGDIGMDAYYARRYIEAQAQHTAQREAAQAMALQPGDKIGTVRTSDLKRITGMTVTSVSNDGAAIELTGKRGSAAVVWKTTPMGLKIAIDRAAEKGQRKDGFEAFTAARKTKPQKAAPAPAPAEAPAAAAVAASFAIGAAQASSAAAPASEAGELAEVCADTPPAEAEAAAQAHTPQASSAADYTGPLKTLAQAGDYTPALKTHRLRSEFFAASNVQNSAAKSGAWRAAMFLTSTYAPALRFTGPDGVDHYAEHASGPERMRALQAMAQAAESEAREAAASAPAPSKKHRAAAGYALKASTQAEHLADAEKLEAANDHSTALYCRCLAAGFADLAAKLLPLIETQDKAGHLTDAIGQQRAAIAAELKARQQASAAHTPQASGAAPAGYTAPLKTQAADCTEPHETPAALAPFGRTQPVKVDLRVLIKGGMQLADLVGLGVNYGGDMANAAGTGAIVSAEACELYGLKVGIMLEDGRAWRTEPHSFSDSPGSRLALNWKSHGAPYLAQLSAAVAASKASESSAQELKRQEHARQLETLAAEFPHLERANSKHGGGTMAARNIRTMLKTAFPGVKFSVKSDYSSVNVRWTDGPTNTQVNAVIDRFDIGRADHQSDYFYTESSAWSDLFGGVQYLFASREESPELVARALEAFNARCSTTATAEDWRRQAGPFDYKHRDGDAYREWFRETLNKTEGAPAAKQRAAAQK